MAGNVLSGYQAKEIRRIRIFLFSKKHVPFFLSKREFGETESELKVWSDPLLWPQINSDFEMNNYNYETKQKSNLLIIIY